MDYVVNIIDSMHIQKPLYSCVSIENLVSNIRSLSSKGRIIIGIAGIACSGKSTLSQHLVNIFNQNEETSVCVSMDGFHLYRYQLEQMDNPIEAKNRRGYHIKWYFEDTFYIGAPYTFNPENFLNHIISIKNQKLNDIYFPSFNHSLKDPVENDICIKSRHKIIIIEGLYILLNQPIWCGISKYLDISVYIDTDIDKAMRRVIDRSLQAGICLNKEEASKRANYNDRKNAILIVEYLITPNIILNGDEIFS